MKGWEFASGPISANDPARGFPRWVSSANWLILKKNCVVVEFTKFCSLKPAGCWNSKKMYLASRKRSGNSNQSRTPTYLWGGEPAGGVGWKYSVIAGVEFHRVEIPLKSGRDAWKFPPKKWRNWPNVLFVGVGTSGSTIATTKLSSGSTIKLAFTAKVTGMTVSGVSDERRIFYQRNTSLPLRRTVSPALNFIGGPDAWGKLTSKSSIGLNLMWISWGICTFELDSTSKKLTFHSLVHY